MTPHPAPEAGPILGRLSLEAIPLHEPILIATFAVVAIGGLAVLALLTKYRLWGYLWTEWFTTVDHKKIGIMYMILGLIMFLRGFADAIMMRTQQALAVNAEGFLSPDHYDQVFSAHGTIMTFFGGMPFVIGLMNFVVPLQLGVRDVAFPTLNSVCFWLTASGTLLVNLSLVLGEFSRTGWLPYAPLSELQYSPGVGVDYYIWAIQISGLGTLLAGINIVTTILKMRAPGMGYFRMPMFCWTSLASCLLIVAAFPILTATLAMLALDRYLGFHFFTNDAGGNMMMFVNLIWAWGHPEVYILILPAFGVFSEVISTFSGKPLFGYRSMVFATLFITVVSFMVWLHHFFTMGAGGDVNATFGIATSVIAVGTGVKLYNWLFTMYGGRIRYKTPMLWAMGFLTTWIFGGMTGVLLAVPPADWMLHNSLFLVAHFHNVIVSGVLFGAFAGLSFWFPKAFGFTLDERWGQVSFWFALAGLILVFTPMYLVGLDGMTRRLQMVEVAHWSPYLWTMLIGIFAMMIGVAAQVVQLVVSVARRDRLRDVTGDPWDGRSLEWSTTSPPPVYNFAILPNVSGEEPYWAIKQRAMRLGELPPRSEYRPIHVPRNNATGFFFALFATVLGFAMVWHIWWLAIVAAFGVYGVVAELGWRGDDEYEISAEELERQDVGRRAAHERWLEAHRAARPNGQGAFAP